MDHEIEYVKRKILASGTDDWVHDVEVCFAARQAVFGEHLHDDYPDDESLKVGQLACLRAEWSAAQERDCLPLGIQAVKELIRDRLVRVGQVTHSGFEPWIGSVEEVESRIELVVQAASFPLLPGDLFWLENTSLGDELAAHCNVGIR